jgi:hypothetical protein
MAVVAIGLLAAVQVGSSAADWLHAATPGVLLACFTAPIVIVSAAFWLIGRRR